MVSILVMNPEGRFINKVREYLKKSGFDVINVEDRLVGLRYLSRIPSQFVVLVDDSLAGRQACSQIRYFSNVPIITICSVNSDDVRAIMLDLGADTCLSYPFSTVELAARIHAVLRRYRQQRSSYTVNNLWA